jgi:hypothetical protein
MISDTISVHRLRGSGNSPPLTEEILKSRVLLRCAVLISLSCNIGLSQQSAGKRRALIIGNAAYSAGASLAPTTINDANAVYTALLAAGFDQNDVERKFNRTHDEMVTDIAEFSHKLQPEDKGLFYFSGHGFSIGAENYIVPIGFQVGDTQTATETAAISASSVINRLLAAGTQVLIFDSCRDEPDIIKQLPKAITNKAPVKNMVQQFSEGSLIAFAAGSGKKADATPIDGKSIYTYYLVKNLGMHYGDLQDTIEKTRKDVFEATHHQQNPGVYNNLQGDFPLGEEQPNVSQSADLNAQTITDALRRNISRTKERTTFIYTFNRWQIWLALPPNLASQVEKVTYTYPNDYFKHGNTRYGDLNASLGLTSWLANTCGDGAMQVDVEIKGTTDHVKANFDLCKVPESSDIPPTTTQ